MLKLIKICLFIYDSWQYLHFFLRGFGIHFGLYPIFEIVKVSLNHIDIFILFNR